MKTNNNNNNETKNRVNNINDFGAKIGGARKDLYQAANEWAAQLADITPAALTKAGGVSKLVRLPNLEKMTEAGAITADQARAALIIWRGIERKPQGSWRAERWAERTRARLEAAADIITNTEPQADDVRDIIQTARESAEFAVITAAQWPAVAFSFGSYSVMYYEYSTPRKLRIIGGRYYRGEASTDPADIARQLREMTAADAEKAADRRAAGPALCVYMNRAGLYYIAPADRSEIVLRTYENRADALKAYREDRAALVERFTALKNFPACRRDWNRPRLGEDWRKGENMTPENFADVLPFRGVEFGNWVNQTERAALLNSAFDGFHDLAAVLNIAPAAVTLNGSLAFAFASRGHSGAAAHYEPARRVINLTKKNGAGCMAHEWFHAVDNFAAGGGVHNYATERTDHPAANAILQAIKKTAYYKRSQNLAKFKGEYWTEGRELTARAFEGVCAVMLNAAGICSDFLVNCKSMDQFTAEDVEHRSEFYPYPTADEAAALLPLYVTFLREVFGDVLTAPAACYEEAKRAAERAEEERKEAERIAAERAEAERQERERKAAELRQKQEREAEEKKRAAAHTFELLRDVLTARHFDAIATGCDSVTAYAVAHLEGEIYTLCADIKTANTEGRPYVEQLPAACIQYKRVHNAKRIICRRYQVPEIRANKWNARELVENLTSSDPRDICRAFDTFEKSETWEKAARIWSDTQRLHETQSAPRTTHNTNRETGAPAAGLHLEEMAGGVYVIGDDWKDTYFNKKAIKANGGHWNKDAQQWEATDPADVAKLRAWFALREQTTAPTIKTEPQSDTADTLQEAGEITDTTNEPAAVVALPEWLKVGAKVRTKSRYMMTTRSSRPEWVEGEEMEITAISADFVSLKSDTARESVSTATAAAELTPIYSASEISQPAESEPAAIAASIDTNEPETNEGETGTAGRVKWARNAEVITTEEMGRVDVFEIVDEWPAGYYVWNIGREHFPVIGYLPLCKDGHNAESWQRNIDRDHLKAIKVQSETAALACMDYAHHHDRPTREDFLQVLAQYPTDPTPDPSGEGVGVCHSYETGAPCYSTSEKSEPITDPLADIISEAKKQESRTVSGLNYGPIKYLRDRVLYATNGKTTAENIAEYESNLHRVTDADTYAAYLLSRYDVFVDETQVYWDLRRAFPSLTFQELCGLIREHMGENQQGNGIAAALVPDCVILSSSDDYTRNTFRERHEKFCKLSSYWKGKEVNTNRESDLKKHYDRESLAVHFLLSHELFYSWGDNRHREDCLNDVCVIYDDMTIEELHAIRDKYAPAISEIYG